MEIRTHADDEAAAREAARLIAAEARKAVAERGRFIVAFSGGRTPRQMLRDLAAEDVPWSGVHVVQVDERVAPDGAADRNLTQLRADLLARAPLSPERIHPMPVEEPDLDAAARGYQRLLERIAGTPPVLDAVHLGLGADGHTASLVPGDPALLVTDREVAVTGAYQGRRRMTLTFPVLDRSRLIVWLVVGEGKAAMLRRLRAADETIPAGRVRQERAVVLTDEAAAGTAGDPPKR